MNREAFCPERGFPLSVSVEEDEKQELKIILFCDVEDKFRLEISTGLTNEDLHKLKDKEEMIRKMRIRVERGLSYMTMNITKNENYW